MVRPGPGRWARMPATNRLEEATHMMKPRTVLSLLAAAAATIGCATQSQMLAQRQDGAVQAALQRGRFDLNCPQATATVLSSDFVQPAVQGPWVNGLERLEYTVGVAGCNQRTSYVVLCQVGTDTCFAAQPRDQYQGGQGPPR